MRYCEDEHFKIDVRMHEEQLTGIGGWTRRWKYRDGKGAIGSSAVGRRVDSSFFRCVEEGGLESRLSDLLNAYLPGKIDVSKSSLRLVCLD